ncbi:hypothetical protein M0E87_06125 [Corynebacterium sp. CCM 9185]|uniref:Uncharacterized protein n=1 Tax=Corynebacterium marambiense TaxID=2765364 RepID=A0ABS0VUQ2_9CORY|nr:hypothetical protein [Corynebacterium marambiense]MBI9000497.1 hypothetical protein [Corynebacterium marambiense]MCK7663240.1 hypothetical protein [Corynebacterium marambiense]MCX7542855.1 hypothetical protein [Corynebacterium marambiense]
MRYRTHRICTAGVAALTSGVLVATGVLVAAAVPAEATTVTVYPADTAKRTIARELTLESIPVGDVENHAQRYLIKAHLTSADPATGHGIAGQVVTFSVSGPASEYTVDVVTDAKGAATIYHVVTFEDEQALESGVQVTASVDSHYEDHAIYGAAEAKMVVELTGTPDNSGSSGSSVRSITGMITSFYQMILDFFTSIFGMKQ